ncbi:SDR family NAD(P)-dependent oxidoreductase [Sphingomonas nostoxanthinifaciens]|uniref:SDR family NAD(P)-dependent oxidoreductase n=1 Tax=Sphingomonas nostoxanthinifaciens TaxID=2872652 RepID=UPI0021D898C6|nr:SDR family NAD(P)-dependent oxidoreductase [Sphingomonas nostoxanthinifaciens]
MPIADAMTAGFRSKELPMTRLARKFALVTGGTSGIGLATARRFIEEGAVVAITGTSEEKLAAAKAELGDVLTIQADAGDIAHQALSQRRSARRSGVWIFCSSMPASPTSARWRRGTRPGSTARSRST